MIDSEISTNVCSNNEAEILTDVCAEDETDVYTKDKTIDLEDRIVDSKDRAEFNACLIADNIMSIIACLNYYI